MATRSRVAVLRTKPETVLADIDKLVNLAGVRDALAPSATTILKDNISWHFPFPGANTTPWQLEGTILALRQAGFADQVCVQNKTVVTNAFKGEDLNHYVPIFKKYGIPVLYNFRDQDMTWIEYKPKAKMLVLDKIFPEGIRIPDYFVGKNVVHLPTTKCVAGDTTVVLADGSVRTVRDLADEAASHGSPVQVDGDVRYPGNTAVFAMEENGAVRPHRVSWLWRTTRGGRRVVRMRTKTGRTLTATEEHPVWTPRGWRSLGSLVPGDRVAIARRIAAHGSSQALPVSRTDRPTAYAAPRAGHTYSREFIAQVLSEYAQGCSATNIAARVGVRWQTIQSILRRHSVRMRRNVQSITTPERTSCDLWRWIGYMVAEGCIQAPPRGSHKIWWVNTHPALREDFKALSESLFGIAPKEHASNPGMHLYSRRLGEWLGSIGFALPLNSGNKRVPPSLFRCPQDEIAAFVSAYLDGDGHVCRDQAEINAVTRSRGLAQDLQTLFARLGIAAIVRPVQSDVRGVARTYHQVSVGGAGIVEAGRWLRLRHPDKAARLQERIACYAASKQTTNWDVVEIPAAEFRAIREGLGLAHSNFARPSSVATLENVRDRVTGRVARDLVATLRGADGDGGFRPAIDRLAALANEDLAWDPIEEICEVHEPVDLYDLTVPGVANFVANGIVVHNCHIYTTTTGAMKNAFGGLLSTKRHYTHSWIHATLVDLLAIQKEIHTGLFAVMDGTTAGNGPGPRTMFPVVKNMMLAGADQVAIDAVAAKLMGFDPMALDFIRLAHEAKLGVGDPREIDIVGDDVSNENWHFKVGDNGASRIGDLMWFGPLKSAQNLFFRTPLVHAFIFGSEAYHDFYRWPAKDRHTFEKWCRETAWGQLFRSYSGTPTAKV